MMQRILGLLLLAMFVRPQLVVAACGVDRWPVKVAADVDAPFVKSAVMPATIEMLAAIPAPRPLPQERRIGPIETTIYSVTATLIAYRVAPDSNIHMVLADEAGRTMIAQIPSPACAQGSRFLSQITTSRQRFDIRLPASEVFRPVRVPIELQGVGFFDFLQGQRGMAPNGISLHPVLDVDFSPAVRPKAPPPNPRRRAARPPGGCTLPSLTLTASQNSVCGGETMTISWQASTPAASVTIDGIGAFLPASGSRVVNVGASTAYSGRASNACGIGDEAVAVVTLKTAATATLTGPSLLRQRTSGFLNITLSGPTRWTISSSLGNSITPQSDTASGVARYEATRTGTDTVTLIATGGACGSVTRTITITVTPETTTGGIRCCDGSRSPSCFGCSDLRGCCSGHGGVCDCGRNAAESEEQPCGLQ
jgi:hypothetical protein